MKDADQGSAGELIGEGLHIGIVRARFNEALTQKLAEACLSELERLDVDAGDIRHVTVPGALEIPVALHAMAASGEFDALIALGCVIRGETYHFELVANAILTVENEAQAWARAEDKGRDAARVAVEMANLMDDLS